MSSLSSIARASLEDLEARDLYRRRRVIDGWNPVSGGTAALVDGAERIVFCSNDYLGLSRDPRVVAALQSAAARYGAGSGASHLVTGHSREHHALEEELAAFVGRERALLFSTGYMANLGVIATLLGRNDRVFEDRLNHASLIDAALLSRAELVRYPHCDMAALEEKLTTTEKRGAGIIVTDGVFSMDGDVAPVAELAAVARRNDAWLMVDDAHGLGVLGPRGRGTLAAAGATQTDVPLLMGTLGKAFGTQGAFVAGDTEVIELLVQKARTYIYTTALPPAVAAATRVALRIAAAEEERRARLSDNIARFRDGAARLGLALMPSPTAIQPIAIGSSRQALFVSEALWQRGFWVTAIRPPTVPDGTARLRVTLCATHDLRQVDRLLEALADASRSEE